ncbi:MAG: hypothetical protein M9897_09195 [Brumimicrobium sp.]|nr:hypothetical protein [Brumimicrobium sp.]
MENLEFNIEVKRTRVWPLCLFFLFTFLIGSMVWILTGSIFNLIVFLIILYSLSALIFIWYPYRNLVGKLIFHEENLKIPDNSNNTTIIPYNEIDYFKLNYSLRKGIYYRHIDLGNNNKVQIKTKDKIRIYYICIRNKQEEESLKSTIIKLYEKNVKVIESVFNIKTYGLKNLSYEEIQEFKKRYNLIKQETTYNRC